MTLKTELASLAGEIQSFPQLLATIVSGEVSLGSLACLVRFFGDSAGFDTWKWDK